MIEITDLFSHKIHSSGESWPNKLIDIATVFSEFDGKRYDRSAIEKRFSEISPRASLVARDPSKFRDEISAYPAYLGIYRVELINDVWHITLSGAAKKFLITEEPDVPSFLLLQMILFQYPNGMGAAYSKKNNIRIQSNARDKTMDIIKNNIHVSPFRLICLALKADSEIKNIDIIESSITYEEIYILANNKLTNHTASPDIENIKSVLLDFRSGKINEPNRYEKRFHILNHTNFLVADKGIIRIRQPINNNDLENIKLKLSVINSINKEFIEFDSIKKEDDLVDEIKKGRWGIYFDCTNTISQDNINILTREVLNTYEDTKSTAVFPESNIEIIKYSSIYDFKPVNITASINETKNNKKIVYADPELTRIRRQRANLTHKILLEQLYQYLSEIGATSFENEHIDLYSELPSKERFVFEVKSITPDNLLSQTRKGVSQLYEYRYRYKERIGYDVNLFLVYPQEPISITWLQEYICFDRRIGIIWFDENNKFKFSSYCESMVRPLII